MIQLPDELSNIARLRIRGNSATDTGARRRLNFVDGDGITFTLTDDSTNEEVDVAVASSVKSLFDHYTDAGNVDTSETDLYSDTIVANQLSGNGDKLEASCSGVFVSSGTATRQLKVYFAGTAIFDTGALTLSLSSAWEIDINIIRVSNTTVRCAVSMFTQGASSAAYTAYTQVASLDLAATGYILKVTGTAAGVGAASNDIVAKMGYVRFVKRA